MRCMRPACRISTYSSRLEAVMARNLTRSSSGLTGSSASSSTRRLNSIQEWSRPLKSFCFRVVLAMESVSCRVGSLQRLRGKLNRELSENTKKLLSEHEYRMGRDRNVKG